MTSDFWVGRYVKVHLMISDVGRWVGQRGSDVGSAIFAFLKNHRITSVCLLTFIVLQCKRNYQNVFAKVVDKNGLVRNVLTDRI